MLFTEERDTDPIALTSFFFAIVSLLMISSSAFALSSDRYSSSTDSMVNETIELQFQDVEVSVVTAELSRRSGVRFALTSSLISSRVNAQVKTTNWNDAIKSVLAGFSFLATVDRMGRFKKIWLTGTKEPSLDPSFGSGDISRMASRAGEEFAEVELKELPIALWESVEGAPVESPWEEWVRAEPIQMDPALFDSLEVGQPVEIPIPQQVAPVYGVIGENHNQLNGEVQVWSGPIDGSHETASFTITRGEQGTYVTVATGTSIYEVSVDNVTGAGTVVDEVELTKHVTENDFIIPNHPN